MALADKYHSQSIFSVAHTSSDTIFNYFWLTFRKQKMNNARDGKIDFFKGCLMLSVIFGHTINSLFHQTGIHIGLHTLLRTFDMPMFMLISGFLLRTSLSKHGAWRTIANRTSGIVVPTIIFMALAFAIGHNNTFYFLWAVFGCTAIVAIINNALKNKYLQITALVLVVLLFHLTDSRCMNMAYLMPFFVIGFYLNSLEISVKQGLIGIAAFVVAFVFWRTDYTFWNYGANLLHNTLETSLVVCFRLIIGILGIITGGFCMSLIYQKFAGKKITTTITGFGKETLAIYLMQYFIVEIGLKQLASANNCLIRNTVAQHPLIAGYIAAPLLAFGITLIIYLIAVLIKKYKATRWIFGFKIL